MELCIQCLAVLIEQGWGPAIPPQLAAQIVILCSLLGERRPQGLAFTETTDELQTSALLCLFHLFSVLGPSTEAKKLLTSESDFPQLGQTISVILDGIQNGTSVDMQIAATNSLDALVFHITDREIRASFLPGIVSRLTRVLTPQTKLRRNHDVIVGCMAILQRLLRSTMDDDLLSRHTDGTGTSPDQQSLDVTSIINDKIRA